MGSVGDIEISDSTWSLLLWIQTSNNHNLDLEFSVPKKSLLPQISTWASPFQKLRGSPVKIGCTRLQLLQPSVSITDILFAVSSSFIRILCCFQDFQAESSPVLSEADVEEGLTWHVRGPSRLYLPCENCDVQYFYRVREEQPRLIWFLQA